MNGGLRQTAFIVGARAQTTWKAVDTAIPVLHTDALKTEAFLLQAQQQGILGCGPEGITAVCNGRYSLTCTCILQGGAYFRGFPSITYMYNFKRKYFIEGQRDDMTNVFSENA